MQEFVPISFWFDTAQSLTGFLLLMPLCCFPLCSDKTRQNIKISKVCPRILTWGICFETLKVMEFDKNAWKQRDENVCVNVKKSTPSTTNMKL